MEPNIVNQHPTTVSAEPRNGVIAFLLSLLLPGLGQLYNGQPKKAFLFFGIVLLVPFIFGLTRGATSFYGLIALLVIEIAFRLYIIIDAVIYAKRQKDYVLKPYNTWYYHLIIAIGMLAILMVYNTSKILGIQSFKIPASSNQPTLQVGDWLMADLQAYQNTQPDYGDLVVYARPGGETYTFRVVGLPNDRVELIDNVVSVNGKPSNATLIKETTDHDMPLLEFEEELPNGHKHLIYKLKQPYDSTKTNIKNIVVPPHSYYLLGDNRDNAADSRYEGFIGKDRIKGRMIYTYWGQTTNRINIDLKNK